MIIFTIKTLVAEAQIRMKTLYVPVHPLHAFTEMNKNNPVKI